MCVKDKHKLPPQTVCSSQRQRRGSLHRCAALSMVLILKRALVQIFTFAYWKKGKAKLKLVLLHSGLLQPSASQRSVLTARRNSEMRNRIMQTDHYSLLTLDNQHLYHTWKMWLLQLTTRIFFSVSFHATRSGHTIKLMWLRVWLRNLSLSIFNLHSNSTRASWASSSQLMDP